MPAPTAYTEDALAAYMLQELGDVGDDLGISTGGLAEPVNDVLLDYGTDDISTITGVKNIHGLRALAAVHAWRVAFKNATARYDMADGTQNLKRSQVLAGIAKQLLMAESVACTLGYGPAGSGLKITVERVNYVQDPYLPIDESPTGLPPSDVFLP